MSVSISPSPEKPKRRLRLGLAVSIIVHSCLLVALVVIPYKVWFSGKKGASGGDAGSVAKREGKSEVPPEEPGVIKATPEQTARAEKVMTDKVTTELDSAIEDAKQLSDEEKLAKLDKLADKLDKVSSEKSLDELSKSLQGFLGTKERATEPAKEPVAGQFDYDTAQFHDVKREELADGGGFVYKSVLLDAAGRTVEVEMDIEEGERTYNALALVKGNPLLEKVYRQITIPLLDKLIKAADKAGEQTENAPTPPVPATVPDEAESPELK